MSLSRQTDLYNTGHNLKVDVDLGEVDYSKTVDLNLLLVNRSGRPLRFSVVETTCVCTKAKVSTDEVLPGDKIAVAVELNPAAKSRTSIGSTELQLVSPDGTADSVEITLNYRLAGMLKFSQPVYSFSVNPGEDSVELSMPFVATLPVSVDETVPEVDDTRVSVEVERFSAGDFSGRVVLSINRDDLSSHGIAGNVRVSFAPLGRQADAPFVIRVSPAVRISPTVIRFFRTHGKIKGSAILTIGEELDSPPFAARGEKSSSAKPIVEAFLNGARVETSIDSLSVNLLRITLQLSDERLEKAKESGDGDLRIKWVVKRRHNTATQITRAVGPLQAPILDGDDM